MMTHACNPSTQEARQKDPDLHITSPCLKTKVRQTGKTKQNHKLVSYKGYYLLNVTAQLSEMPCEFNENLQAYSVWRTLCVEKNL